MNTPKIIIFVVVILVILGLGLWYANTSTPKISTPQTTQKEVATDTPLITNSATNTTATNTPNKKNMTAILHTNKGDITITLTPETTPKTVANFVKLAQEGFYNNTKFHRVIKGFMNQGGDPLSKDDSQIALWGTGGPEYTFADEIGPKNKNSTGTIAMANAGPNTNGSQFFINVADNNFLDTKHTVFGYVSEGIDVVMAINSVATNAQDRPLEPVVINNITIK